MRKRTWFDIKEKKSGQSVLITEMNVFKVCGKFLSKLPAKPNVEYLLIL